MVPALWALLASLMLGVAGCANLAPSSSASKADPDSDERTDATQAEGRGPADRNAAARSSEPEEALPPLQLSREILFQVLAAEIAFQRGEVARAAATMLALAQSTRDPRLARRATELALTEGSRERALQSAQLWYSISPGSSQAARWVEELYLGTNRLTEAEPLVAARLAKARAESNLAAVYPPLQRTLLRATDKGAALAMLERLAQPDQKVPEALQALAAVAQAAGQNDRAADLAIKAMALKPDDGATAVNAAQYVMQGKGGAPEAIKLIESFLKRSPKSVEARYAYARLLAESGKTDAARNEMEHALKDEPDSPSLLFALAQLAYQTKQLPVAENYLKRYLALPRTVQRDNVPAYLFLSQIAEEDKRPGEAISWLENVTRGEQFLSAVIKRALLMGRLKRVEEARELLRTTSVPNNRERVQLTAAEAQLLREAQRFADAFDVLDKALERLPNNPDLLYDHGMAAEKINRIDVMETSLRKLIQLRPDNAHAYNALGYSFAERNMRLDDAQTLIEKALALSPDDAHILDSMGWVLFRKGQLDKAEEYLRRAYGLRPEAEIATHLGEVLWKMGKAAQAREFWKLAQTREPGNETLRETLARLNVAL